jgi:hypothetical protein
LVFRHRILIMAYGRSGDHICLFNCFIQKGGYVPG